MALRVVFLLLLLGLSCTLLWSPTEAQSALTCEQLTWDRPEDVPEYFYPFGADLDSIFPRLDDASTGRLSINTTFIFYYQAFRHIYVNSNGVLSFLSAVTQFTPDSFPLNGLPTDPEDPRRFVMIAPFWADIDLRENDGALYYRQTKNESILCVASSFIRSRNAQYSDFQASWAYIATWHGVTFYGGSSTSNVNTFQAVLVTDGTLSFVIFNFGNITWTAGTASGGNSSGLGGVGAEVGFNAGDGINFFTIPGSRNDTLVNLGSTIGNTMLVGQWYFRVDGEDVLEETCAILQTRETIFLSPVTALYLGGKWLRVSGPCFDENTAVMCRVNDSSSSTMTPGVVIDTQIAACLTPLVRAPGRYRLELSINGGSDFNYSGLYIATEEDSQYQVTMVDEDRWLNGSYEMLTFTWDPTVIDASHIRVDYMDFSNGVTGRRITLIPNTTNNGSALLPEGLPDAESADLTSDLPLVGAIRLSNADISQVSQHQWSYVIPAFWFQYRYYIEIYTRTTEDQPLPPSAQTVFDAIQTQLDAAEGNRRRRALSLLVRTLRYGPLVAIGGILTGEAICSLFSAGETPDFSGLPIPPCNAQQARDDDNFTPDDACHNRNILGRLGCSFFHNGAAECFRSTTPVNGQGQQVCYDANGDIITDGERGGGTVDASFAGGIDHVVDDVIPFLACCKLTNRCDDYFEKRPVQDCTGYDPPNNGWTGGDPHIQTLDGHLYTFNGHGEYWVARSPSRSFSLQGRMTPFGDAASAMSAVVAEWNVLPRVQLEINPNNQGISVRINGTLQDSISLALYQGVGAPICIEELDDTVRVVFYDEMGAENCTRLTIEARQFMSVLSVTILLPPCFGGQTEGLIGNYNMDITDDLIPRGSITSLPADSNETTIHYMFGETWRITQSESLFTYMIGETYDSLQDPGFVPAFISLDDLLTPEAEAICGTNRACLFDLNITGSEAFATNTMQEVQRANETNALFIAAQDPCFSRPCGSGGDCTSSGTTFRCTCFSGFTGSRCEIVITACSSGPCQHGGECRLSTSDPRGYECACPGGYSGPNCETAVTNNPCDTSSPCQNGATCFYLNGQFLCRCAPGFTGDRCETELPVMSCQTSSPCQNGATCLVVSSRFICRCAPGFIGDRCETDLSVTTDCRTVLCENGGVCSFIDLLTGYRCRCPAAYVGSRCQISLSNSGCLGIENPCENGGTCYTGPDGEPRCRCPPGYSGVNCNVDSKLVRDIIIYTVVGVLVIALIGATMIGYWRYVQTRRPRLNTPPLTARRMVPFNPNFQSPARVLYL